MRIFIVQGGTLFNKLIQLDLILLNNFYLYIMWYIFLKIERNKEKSATGLCFEGLQGDVDAIGYWRSQLIEADDDNKSIQKRNS